MKQRFAPEDWAAAFNRPTWACAGKDAFAERTLADRVLFRMRRNRIARKAALKVYRCNFCHHWHIGGQ